jgi:hypothetical protein
LSRRERLADKRLVGSSPIRLPPTAIVSTLPMIAQLGGCGDVTNFGAVKHIYSTGKLFYEEIII